MSKTPSSSPLRTVEQLQEIPNDLSGQPPDFFSQKIVEVDFPLNTLGAHASRHAEAAV